MVHILIFLVGAIICATAFLLWYFLKLRKQYSDLRSKYSSIIDVEAEREALKKRLGQSKSEQQEFEADNDRRRVQLNREYEQALSTFKELKNEISLLEENIEDISFGVYKPHFSFQSAEEYKSALEKLRNDERQMIRNGQAAVCPITWTVHESKQEGKRMVKSYEKLLLRAFNGECEAAIANVSWNNVNKMEERIRKSYEAINMLGEVTKVSITNEYLKLKLDEVRLTYEYEDKRYQEREEQRRVREEMREEERAQREIEKAREEAELEEKRFQKALERAREEAAKATGAQLKKLTEQISSFEAKLDEARQKKERAISRAQLTKSGFVYIISNIGSFGERVVKIGMTRRLDPQERIDELGGASVPFPFDLHAVLYSDNAPELENSLHQRLAERKMNLMNPRSEFYRDVDLEEIETYVKAKGLSAQFIKHPEAKQYRESLAKQQQYLSNRTLKQPEKFADSLFGKG